MERGEGEMKDNIMRQEREGGNGKWKWGEDLREEDRAIFPKFGDMLFILPCFPYTVFFQTDNSGSFRTNLSSPLEQGKKDVA